MRIDTLHSKGPESACFPALAAKKRKHDYGATETAAIERMINRWRIHKKSRIKSFFMGG